MEFGGFDDDLFTEPEKKPKNAVTVDYKPKTLSSQWFTEDDALPREEADQVHFFIFRGNRHYYRGEWAPALDAYTSAMNTVTSNNIGMRRLLLESIARCRWRCGDAGGAVEMGETLLAESMNDHQIFGAHSVLATFYEAAENAEGQAKSLRCCLDIRPLSAQHWIQLAKLYLKQSRPKDFKDSRKTLPDNSLQKNVDAKNHKGQCHGKEGQHVLQRTRVGSLSNEELEPSSTHDSTLHISNDQLQNRTDVCLKAQNDDATEKQELRPSAIKDPNEHCISSKKNTEHEDYTKATDNSTQNELRPCSTNIPRVSNSGIDVQKRTYEQRDSIADHNTPNAGSLLNNLQDRVSQNGTNRDGISINSALNGDVPGLEKLSLRGDTTTLAKDCDDEGKHSKGLSHLEIEAVQCLLKAQVIVKSLQICAVSITKMRNAQLLAEIDELLSSLKLDQFYVQEITKKMYNVVFHKEAKEDMGTS